ncbi:MULTISPECIES: ABC transporter permease [Brevibacterium]|uniref:ABC transporter permease n=1 Tax=Brevibacterium salitolerans TaxID=1403566 RepID=A0ABN2WSM2_9MICO|nr:ABC transporter permease [Brevibacterium sp.]
MNQPAAALHLLLDPATWSGPAGLGARVLEHLQYSLLAVLLAACVALPIGFAVGHFRRGRNLVVAASGTVRALPTLGLLTLVALFTGLGLLAPMVALVVLAVPSVLAGAYSGVESVDENVVDAARAQGMSRWQVLVTVQIPLGLPLILGGIRLASLQVVGTAILAAYVGAGGLGAPLFLGLRTYDYPLLLAASAVVIVLALVLDLAFGTAQRLLRRLPGLRGGT